MSLTVGTCLGTTDVIQIIHAKHLLIRFLDYIENRRRGLINWLATVQPLSAGVGEAESGKVPETGSPVMFITRIGLEPIGTLGI